MSQTKELITDDEIISRFFPNLSKTWENTITVIERADRFNHLLYSFEVLLKSLSAILCCRLKQYNIDTNEIDSILNSGFQQPSLGTWSHLLRVSRRKLIEENDRYAIAFENKLRQKSKNSSTVKVLSITRNLQGLTCNKQQVTYGEIFGNFIELRNRTKGHGAINRNFYQINDDLTIVLRDLFTCLHELLDDAWYIPQSMEPDAKGNKNYTMKSIQGTSKRLKSISIDKETALNFNQVYCYDQGLTNT